jgi:hypothetical protein
MSESSSDIEVIEEISAKENSVALTDDLSATADVLSCVQLRVENSSLATDSQVLPPPIHQVLSAQVVASIEAAFAACEANPHNLVAHTDEIEVDGTAFLTLQGARWLQVHSFPLAMQLFALSTNECQS